MNGMTWLWILLWVVFSAIILGASFWSTIILQKQKRAWSEFAKKHKLKYIGGKFMESPTVAGTLRGFSVSFFSALRDPDDPKARRYVSVIEIKALQGLAGSSAAGTAEMVPFMQTLSALKPYEVNSVHWDKNFRFFTRDAAVTDAYLDNARIRHLNAILATKNADVLVMFDETAALVRVETPDPVQEIAKIEKVMDHLIKNFEPLMIDERQRAAIIERARTAVQESAPPAPAES